ELERSTRDVARLAARAVGRRETELARGDRARATITARALRDVALRAAAAPEVRAVEREVELADVLAAVSEAGAAVDEPVERQRAWQRDTVQLRFGAPEALAAGVQVHAAAGHPHPQVVGEVERDRDGRVDGTQARQLAPLAVRLEEYLPARCRPAQGQARLARGARRDAAILTGRDRAPFLQRRGRSDGLERIHHLERAHVDLEPLDGCRVLAPAREDDL